MRIGIISTTALSTPPQRYGGMERIMWWLSVALKNLGHEVTLFAASGSQNPDKLYTVSGSEHDMANLVKEHLSEVDILHDNTHDKVTLAELNPTNYVTTLHVQHLAWTANTVCISKAQRSRVGLSDKTPVVYYGIGLDEYPLHVEKKDYLLYMGSILDCKGVDTACMAASKLDVPLYIAGPNWDSDYWNYFKSRYLLMGKAEYVGDLGGSEKLQLLQEARALIHPIKESFVDFRGQPQHWTEAGAIIMLEALACGTPVLTTYNGVSPEYITNGVNGYMCQDVDEFVSSYNLLNVISPEACQASISKYNSARMAEDYVALYNKVLEGQSW